MGQRRETVRPATLSIGSMSLLVSQPALMGRDPLLRHTLAWPVLMPAAPVKGRAGALAVNLDTTSCLTLALVSPHAGRLSFPHPTRLASPATEAVESALDPDLTTASHALPITHWLQAPAFPPVHPANTRCLGRLLALAATPPAPPVPGQVQQLAPLVHPQLNSEMDFVQAAKTGSTSQHHLQSAWLAILHAPLALDQILTSASHAQESFSWTPGLQSASHAAPQTCLPPAAPVDLRGFAHHLQGLPGAQCSLQQALAAC